MQRIHSKGTLIYGLLNWAHSVGMRRLARDYEDGGATLLGGFDDIEGGQPGWIVEFADIYFSKLKTYVAVIAGSNHRLRYKWLAIVDWSKYAGDTSENPLYQGDDPETYKELKEQNALWHVKRTTT